jgi:hypothetical protein
MEVSQKLRPSFVACIAKESEAMNMLLYILKNILLRKTLTSYVGSVASYIYE